MDKIAPLLAWLKKNRFWLGSAFLAIGMLATWYLATTELAKQTSSFKSAVSSQISSAKGIRSVTATDVEEGIVAHPNNTTEDGMKQQLSEQVDLIVKGWEKRHADQASILKWPTEVIGSEKFVKVFSRFDPPETFPSSYKGLGMEQYLTLYRTNIPKQMDLICKAVRTNWRYSPEKLEEMRRGSRNADAFDPTNDRAMKKMTDDDMSGVAVLWEQANQSLWYSKLTQFKDYDDHNLPTPDPTPLQVYMLQQDLWLLEAMFDIIRKINGDVDANDLAVIKQIDHVAFGREARTQLGQLTPVDTRLGGVGGEAEGFDAGLGGGGYPAAVEASADTFDQSASTSPFHGRYVDKDFKPYSADVVREVITGTTLPEENIELIVSKRVPVRIALVMDERKIGSFIAACANSPFAFEIHQVRMNRHQPGEGISLNGGAKKQGGMGGRGGIDMMDMEMDMGGYDMEMDMEMGGGRGMGGSGGRDEMDLDSTPVETRTNYDVSVEFYGIVKIYNPVRAEFLRQASGLETDEPDPADSAAVDRRGIFVAAKD